jgi:antitoxin Phd
MEAAKVAILARLATLQRGSAVITITSVEAQNRFGQLLDTVQREPVAITRHGRPTAFVVSPQEMADVLDARRRRSQAVKQMQAWSAQAAKRSRPAAAVLTDEDVNRLVHEAR